MHLSLGDAAVLSLGWQVGGPSTWEGIGGDETLDWEVELTVVIGKRCRNVKAAQALDYVYGYTVGNDVSNRKWQRGAGASQWIKVMRPACDDVMHRQTKFAAPACCFLMTSPCCMLTAGGRARALTHFAPSVPCS